MTETKSPTLILAVPGTQETRELDIQSVHAAVQRGEIGLDNWAWSPSHNDWLPLNQLPEFAPAVVPAPVAPKAAPVAVQVPMKVKVPAVQAAPVVGHANRLAKTVYSKPMETHYEFPIFKLLFFVLGLLIAALVIVNYYLIDKPYHDKLAKTPFASYQTHAHLGAFVQPNALLIHLRPTDKITPDNFADLLMALAKCAPSQVIDGKPFTTVSLTASWLGEYVITAENWKSFEDMEGLSPDQKRDYVLSGVQMPNGAELVPLVKNETPSEHKARVAKIWDNLVGHFQPKSS